MHTATDTESTRICQVGDYKVTYRLGSSEVTITRRPLPGEQEHLDADLPDLLTRLVALSRDEFGGRLLHFDWQDRLIQVRGGQDPEILAGLYATRA